MTHVCGNLEDESTTHVLQRHLNHFFRQMFTFLSSFTLHVTFSFHDERCCSIFVLHIPDILSMAQIAGGSALGHWKLRVVMMPTLSSLHGDIAGCHYNKLRCQQWRECWHYGNFRFSVLWLLSTHKSCDGTFYMISVDKILFKRRL